MDAKKALEYFKSGYDSLRAYQLTHSPTPETAILASVYTAAIEALDKQVPKEPIKRKIPGSCWYICPSCQKPLERLSKYCSCCGQAIKKE